MTEVADAGSEPSSKDKGVSVEDGVRARKREHCAQALSGAAGMVDDAQAKQRGCQQSRSHGQQRQEGIRRTDPLQSARLRAWRHLLRPAGVS